jgi:deoxyribodipyrimidine photo-lyase
MVGGSMNQKRIRILRPGLKNTGPVVYWMSRDQRVNDNWALLSAQDMALKRKAPLVVIFCLVPRFLNATLRQYGFMVKGLQEVQENLAGRNIPFYLLAGLPDEQVPEFVTRFKAGTLITDFDPLRIKREWKAAVASAISIPMYEVDTHNIVPCWAASPKQEYGAYTLRPKILRLLDEFLVEFPPVRKHPVSWSRKVPLIDWRRVIQSLRVDRTVREVGWIEPGEREAKKALKEFLTKRLSSYNEKRNDPTKDGQSHLSPYLHFGHLSAQRVALEVLKSTTGKTSRDAFLEELIVRRELSDNFCFYNQNYDTIESFPGWARESLKKHRSDVRMVRYSRDQLEHAGTHDDLWNAAQMEMVKKGTMHGYLRMYWAKKILEWTEGPEEAQAAAIYLNDRYELDGRDPNGYTGIAWSIGGTHDRAWGERKIFGKIRFMSYNGCRSKFDIRGYIESVKALQDE